LNRSPLASGAASHKDVRRSGLKRGLGRGNCVCDSFIEGWQSVQNPPPSLPPSHTHIPPPLHTHCFRRCRRALLPAAFTGDEINLEIQEKRKWPQHESSAQTISFFLSLSPLSLPISLPPLYLSPLSLSLCLSLSPSPLFLSLSLNPSLQLPLFLYFPIQHWHMKAGLSSL